MAHLIARDKATQISQFLAFMREFEKGDTHIKGVAVAIVQTVTSLTGTLTNPESVVLVAAWVDGCPNIVEPVLANDDVGITEGMAIKARSEAQENEHAAIVELATQNAVVDVGRRADESRADEQQSESDKNSDAKTGDPEPTIREIQQYEEAVKEANKWGTRVTNYIN